MQAKVSQLRPQPWQASELRVRHSTLIFPSCCPQLSCPAAGRAPPCLPGFLPASPALLRRCETEMLRHCQSSAGSRVRAVENKPVSIP